MEPPEPMVPHCACWNPLAPPLEPGTAILLPLSSDGSTKQEPPVWGELLDLAVAMADLADRATTAEGMPALRDLANLTVERVPSACWASLTVLRARKFRTEAATHPGATKRTFCSTRGVSARAWMPCATTPSTSATTWPATSGGRRGCAGARRAGGAQAAVAAPPA